MFRYLPKKCCYTLSNGVQCSVLTKCDSLCWRHCAERYGFRVQKSNMEDAGQGIFADFTKGFAGPWKAGDKIVGLYIRGLVMPAAIMEGRTAQQNRYTYLLHDREFRCIDATDPRTGYGRYVNSCYRSGHQANVRMVIHSHHEVISFYATRDIHDGDELLTDYGGAGGYWECEKPYAMRNAPIGGMGGKVLGDFIVPALHESYPGGPVLKRPPVKRVPRPAAKPGEIANAEPDFQPVGKHWVEGQNKPYERINPATAPVAAAPNAKPPELPPPAGELVPRAIPKVQIHLGPREPAPEVIERITVRGHRNPAPTPELQARRNKNVMAAFATIPNSHYKSKVAPPPKQPSGVAHSKADLMPTKTAKAAAKAAEKAEAAIDKAQEVIEESGDKLRRLDRERAILERQEKAAEDSLETRVQKLKEAFDRLDAEVKILDKEEEAYKEDVRIAKEKGVHAPPRKHMGVGKTAVRAQALAAKRRYQQALETLKATKKKR